MNQPGDRRGIVIWKTMPAWHQAQHRQS